MRDFLTPTPQKLSSFFLIQSPQLPPSLKLLSKTSINKNFQTFITHLNLNQNTKFLHPITSKHHFKHYPPIKNNFHPPQPTKFVYLITLIQKPKFLHQFPSFNSKTILKPQSQNKTKLSQAKHFQTSTFTKTQTKSTRSMAPKRCNAHVRFIIYLNQD